MKANASILYVDIPYGHFTAHYKVHFVNTIEKPADKKEEERYITICYITHKYTRYNAGSGVSVAHPNDTLSVLEGQKQALARTLDGIRVFGKEERKLFWDAFQTKYGFVE